MPTQTIEFTEWTPDLPSVVRNLSVAKNVVATSIGYAPFPTAVDYSQAASEDLNSVFVAKYGETVSIFAGSATKLFKVDGDDLSVDDVSRVSSAYSTSNKWTFCQFGNIVIAANNEDKLQSYLSANFQDLDAAAPIAKFVTVVRDFVVAANLDSGANPNKIAWSDINDETNWTPSATSQSDSQVLPDGGNITGITGGEFGLILMERAIIRMQYIGSPYFFSFETISKSLGCTASYSVVKYGDVTYFLGDDGFYACDGRTITPIGNQKVDKWFYTNISLPDLNSMTATVDPSRKIIIWNFKNIFGSRQLIIYNWQVNKWTYGDTIADVLATLATPGKALEGIDSQFEINASAMVNGRPYTITSLGTGVNWTSMGAEVATVGARLTRNSTAYSGSGGKVIDLNAAAAQSKTLDTLTTSLDSSLYAGGQYFLGGSSGAKVVSFTGANALAQIDTGYIGNQYNSTVTLARPIVDNGSADIAILSVNLLSEVKEFSSYTSADYENRVPLRSNGKYHKLSIKPTGDRWSNIMSVDVDITPQGIR